MENEIIKMASSQGMWATLTVGLIFYVLKSQEKRDVRQEDRENKYQEIIINITEKLNLVEDVKKDVKDIKEYVFSKNK